MVLCGGLTWLHFCQMLVVLLVLLVCAIFGAIAAWKMKQMRHTSMNVSFPTHCPEVVFQEVCLKGLYYTGIAGAAKGRVCFNRRWWCARAHYSFCFLYRDISFSVRLCSFA